MLAVLASDVIIGRILSGLLGVMFVGYGCWRLRAYIKHYYPRRPK